jgi:hypothetical protein
MSLVHEVTRMKFRRNAKPNSNSPNSIPYMGKWIAQNREPFPLHENASCFSETPAMIGLVSSSDMKADSPSASTVFMPRARNNLEALLEHFFHLAHRRVS